MQVKDLRIGDIVQYHDDKTDNFTIIEIKGIDGMYNAIINIIPLKTVHMWDVFPVKLTTEILKNNGWKEDGDDYWTTLYKFVLHKINEGDGQHFEVYYGIEYIRDIKYVHELQHILWAFGKENIMADWKF